MAGTGVDVGTGIVVAVSIGVGAGVGEGSEPEQAASAKIAMIRAINSLVCFNSELLCGNSGRKLRLILSHRCW